MKALKVLLIGMVVLGFTLPAFAAHVDDDPGWRFNIDTVRYRFDWEIASAFDESGDTVEFMDDDFDTTWSFQRGGDLTIFFDFEVADSNLGDDVDPQGSYADALGGYAAIWTPEAMADSEFTLTVGDFGTGFGKAINNDDSPHGSIGVAWKMGNASMVLEYGRTYEGDTNDDVEGDGHLVRGQVHMPLGESGFNVGAYAAMYSQTDVLIQEATEATVEPGDANVPVIVPGAPAIQGDQSAFIGALEMSGSMGNVSVYSEASFLTGTQDFPSGDAAFERDLSGFYIMGGATFNVGQITLGVEGGFSPGDDDPDDDEVADFTRVNSDFWIGQILHDEGLIVNSVGQDGGIANLIYVQGSASMSPSEKLSLSGNAVYLAPVEEVGEVDTYGFELFGDVSYQLGDYVKYVLYYGFAFPDENFIDETLYQITNRLEFAF
ncbi:hypothetical protein GF339_13095 [candidate division KSB3 bacterium]|uniref:Alginate export domain-containing protein n=1 Tax=candidate division KSB3 bacterium TaxID=2044937 RepID=A0A9D5JWQ8_9BACT|nr:hypothetical protein [candidate division KSB3 bacterium]MBD3325520.1 hypothetical protein [candidate division KSB3 bacterium]